MQQCKLCPRGCGIDRHTSVGFCQESNDLRVARIAPHYFEEPCISGSRGSGTIFFSGCSLRCVFCQNKDISRVGGIGETLSNGELYERILSLQELGVHNINLVTPTHFVHKIAPILEKLKATGELRVPVVYNSSGYESVQTLRRLDGLVDIYMPDFKYFSAELAKKYSSASDYPVVATETIKEMFAQVGKYRYSQGETDILERGLIVRHLVLPACRHDSINVMRHLAAIVPPDDILLSLMSQYTPEFALDTPYTELHRRVTSFEYSSVVNLALELGFNGFIQQRAAANVKYTPDFKKQS